MKKIYTHTLKKISLLGLLLLTLWGTTGCNSFLKEHSDDLAYIRTFDDLDKLLLGSCYMTVNPRTPLKYPNFYVPFIHYMADETEEIKGTTRYNPESNIRTRIFGYYTWQKNVGYNFDGTTYYDESVDWLRFYNHISSINIVLQEAQEMQPTSPDETLLRRKILAEAHFLRAVYNFFLVNLYAEPYSEANRSKPGIPLKTEHFIEDKKFTRSTLEEVYNQIIADLEEAISLMSGVTQKSKYRASQESIELFLSRVYLFTQQWQKAADMADKVLATRSTLENLNAWPQEKFFHSIESPEMLFSMGGSLIYVHLASSAPVGRFQVSKELYDLYAKEDLRKAIFFAREKSKDVVEGYYVHPIKQNPDGPYRSDVSEIFALRVAEAYLNKAEAAAMMGKEAEALDALNALLRTRTKVDAFSPLSGLSQEQLVQTVRDERRKELCFEGHRWFDLRRYRVSQPFPYRKELTNSYTVYVKEGKYRHMQATYVYTVPQEDDAAYVLPIPLEEKEINDVIVDVKRPERTPSKILTYENEN